MQENRMYSQMLAAAKARLVDRDPWQIAKRANVSFNGSVFSFCSLGKYVTVSYPVLTISPELKPWHQLVILHYLDLADGAPLTGQMVAFGQQKDGMVRGGDFDRKAENAICKHLGNIDPVKLRSCCLALGGVERKTNADLCIDMRFLPMYPVRLNLWFADEEFPASGRLLLDSSAEHYLTIEDSVTVGDIVLQALEET